MKHILCAIHPSIHESTGANERHPFPARERNYSRLMAGEARERRGGVVEGPPGRVRADGAPGFDSHQIADIKLPQIQQFNSERQQKAQPLDLRL